MWIGAVFVALFAVTETVLSAEFLKAQVTNWPDPGEKAPLLDTICCIVWIQTALSWGVALAALKWRDLSLVLGLLAASFLVSYFLGKWIGSMLADHKAELWDELWRYTIARRKIDAAYKAKNVGWLRDLARSQDQRTAITRNLCSTGFWRN